MRYAYYTQKLVFGNIFFCKSFVGFIAFFVPVNEIVDSEIVCLLTHFLAKGIVLRLVLCKDHFPGIGFDDVADSGGNLFHFVVQSSLWNKVSDNDVILAVFVF